MKNLDSFSEFSTAYIGYALNISRKFHPLNATLTAEQRAYDVLLDTYEKIIKCVNQNRSDEEIDSYCKTAIRNMMTELDAYDRRRKRADLESGQYEKLSGYSEIEISADTSDFDREESYSCFLKAFADSINELSSEENKVLGLEGIYDAVLIGKKIYAEPEAFERHRITGVGKLVVAGGKSREEIGRELGISASNVGFRRSELRVKLEKRAKERFMEIFLGESKSNEFDKILRRCKGK